jgi:hypothetical protein
MKLWTAVLVVPLAAGVSAAVAWDGRPGSSSLGR